MGAPKTDEAAIRQTIRALKAAGYVLDRVHDGGEEIKVSTEQEAIDAIMAVDDAYLFVNHADGERGSHIRFVLGNDPEEVICDHGVSLSHVLDPLTEKWW
jgi:hypothetical protein